MGRGGASWRYPTSGWGDVGLLSVWIGGWNVWGKIHIIMNVYQFIFHCQWGWGPYGRIPWLGFLKLGQKKNLYGAFKAYINHFLLAQWITIMSCDWRYCVWVHKVDEMGHQRHNFLSYTFSPTSKNYFLLSQIIKEKLKSWQGGGSNEKLYQGGASKI